MKQQIAATLLAFSAVTTQAQELKFLETDSLTLYVVGESFRYGNRQAMADFVHINRTDGKPIRYTVVVDSDSCRGKNEGVVYIAEGNTIIIKDYWSSNNKNPRVIDLQSLLVCKTYQKAINLRWY